MFGQVDPTTGKLSPQTFGQPDVTPGFELPPVPAIYNNQAPSQFPAVDNKLAMADALGSTPAYVPPTEGGTGGYGADAYGQGQLSMPPAGIDPQTGGWSTPGYGRGSLGDIMKGMSTLGILSSIMQGQNPWGPSQADAMASALAGTPISPDTIGWGGAAEGMGWGGAQTPDPSNPDGIGW